MNRIEQAFNGKKALIPYVAACHPDYPTSLQAMNILAEAGADVIELGVPFSDPMADGPIIQQAYDQALANGASLTKVLQLVTEFRQNNQQTAIVLMSYLNPIEQMGYDIFAKAAKQAGVDGVLVVDEPIEEADALSRALSQQAISNIFLVSPTTRKHRLQQINQKAQGYLYYVSMKGVTGTKSVNSEDVAEKLQFIRQHVTLPIAVGFGIKDAKSAHAIGEVADGVVVGSAIVQIITQGDLNQLHSFINELRSSL